jgi:hypothetical protein
MVDGFEHMIEHRVEELLRLLGVAICNDSKRPYDVRKQHGDLLTFALKLTLRRHDPDGEMLWSIIVGRQEAVYRTVLFI